MGRSGRFGVAISLQFYLPLLLIINAKHSLVEAGASPSAHKNRLNIHSTSENNSSNNIVISISNSTQNTLNHLNNVALLSTEAVSKSSAAPERYKTSATTTPPSTSTSDSSPVDQSSYTSDSNNRRLDYVYLGSRGSMKVPECRSRTKLSGIKGFITDGPGFYQTNYQCTWLIDSGRENATIRLQVHQFSTECNYDYLYIFDGDSIYSPLIASLSGDMKDFSAAFTRIQYDYMISSNHSYIQSSNERKNTTYPVTSNSDTNSSTQNNWSWTEPRTFEIRTYSGKAFLYFHSDTAQIMSGFYLTYTIDSCPLDCSNRGDCDYTSLTCKCNEGFYGDGCQEILCPNNCTSPQHGTCDTKLSCICNSNYYGPDCSYKIEHQAWIGTNSPSRISSARVFHTSVVVDNVMWVLGGKTVISSNTNQDNFRKKETPMVLNYDLKKRTWNDDEIFGITGLDHLAELSGHSVAATGHKIFIYGGIAMNNTVLNSLTVFDTKTRTFSSLPARRKLRGTEDLVAPVAVVGHSANIVGSHMYVFFGFNPIFGFIDSVQRLNLADNTWSFVKREGSLIEGRVGHSSTFDRASGLIYVYGGHHVIRLNSLQSFDPNSGTWTLMQSGPSPRYHHSALVINNQLLIIGGNSNNTSHQSDQCFQATYISYNLLCSHNLNHSNSLIDSSMYTGCNIGNCWRLIEGGEPNIMKRYGHSVLEYDQNQLILYGGFNGILLGDVRFLNLTSCETYQSELDCVKSKIGLTCYWNAIDLKCEEQKAGSPLNRAATSQEPGNCTKNELKALQHLCEERETCMDCLSTNLGCVWCSASSQCQLSRCKSSSKTVHEIGSCYKDDLVKTFPGFVIQSMRGLPSGKALEQEAECKILDNCYLCNSKPYCSWQVERCTYIPQTSMSQAEPSSVGHFGPEVNDDLQTTNSSRVLVPSNSTPFLDAIDPINRSFLTTFTTDLINQSPFRSCDVPCYMRRSCSECTTTRCIWCSTTEQCVDSSAYFAYYPTGQCMHYVAHLFKCPTASCSDIETCDKCLTNPKCGWLNDISNTGKGKCIEGTSGPSLNIENFTDRSDNHKELSANASATSISLSNWYYTSCPACQCNGHSHCRSNSSVCVQPCQDFTEGPNCERCIAGYYGEPTNGGVCRQCRCNGHAQTCNRETGKCYCSTKGIIGHNCNRCDDQHSYIGDPSNYDIGTCYYNLSTDFQYTFNMSKPEDHLYTEINFINVPARRDSDVDFTIACSRLALVNITSGTSFKDRRPIHSNLECGSFRLRFPYDRPLSSEPNPSFFVQVFKFQTPFIIQITFSQHKTLYLQQFFFTFSSCFLFFFALSGLIWKLKLEYDSYVRRQMHFIEMEQMASRPFSSILLEVFKPSSEKVSQPPEPTPISFEPCFSSNVGVLSLFVQLPGKPNLAIGSALVTLNDEIGRSIDEGNPIKRLDKDQNSASSQNL